MHELQNSTCAENAPNDWWGDFDHFNLWCCLVSFTQINRTALEIKQEEEEEKRNRFIPEDFEIDPDFKRHVTYNTTAVHIPTDIYEGCKYTRTHILSLFKSFLL